VRLGPANKSHRRRNTFVLAAGAAAVAAAAKLRRRANLSPIGHRRQNDGYAPHVGGAAAADRGPQRDQGTDGLAERTRQELYALAQQSEIAGRSKMSKEDLIAALRAKHSS
jgi:Rho termination factor, N-terminal domain